MRTSVKITALLLATLAVGPARAQSTPKVSFETITRNVAATIEPAVARRGETVLVRFSFNVDPGYHTYPLQQVHPDALDFVTKIGFDDESAKRVLVPVGVFREAVYITVPNPVSASGGSSPTRWKRRTSE